MHFIQHLACTLLIYFIRLYCLLNNEKTVVEKIELKLREELDKLKSINQLSII